MPKSKVVLSSDPRNMTWSSDSSKFGQRMLEKMGWKNGKGLGRDEDGLVEHIKVTKKKDMSGVGAEKLNSGDNWMENQTAFDDILASLNDSQPSERHSPIKTSLVEKSASTKNRIHYKKFTQGKDLSRASEADLNSILGKRKHVVTEPKSTSLSSRDYFTKKLAARKERDSKRKRSVEEEENKKCS
ncbi:PIN2/TERF1-interacting telomerase inhibitor 1-like [Oscarella lobularis]|uniref:PIN2/TERF1-interacting telomerase inhibitor 1-like n=1 Tax=Oscarella lobularis TaxID=121494 RepID=UPI0033139E12